MGEIAPTASDLVINEGAKLVRDAPLTVDTRPELWSYACLLNLQGGSEVEREVVNGLDLLVVDGAVSVCTVTPGERIIFECDPLSPLPLKQLHHVRILRHMLTGADRIVIRNRSEKGSSRFEIHGWHKVLAPPTSEAASDLVINEGAQFVTDAPLTIDTRPELWSYACFLKLQAGSEVEREVVNGLDLLVVHGAISVCTVTPDDKIIFESDPLTPLPLKEVHHVRILQRMLIGADRIVVRNRLDKGSSRFEIHGWQKVSAPATREAASDLVINEGAKLIGDAPITIDSRPELWSYACLLDLQGRSDVEGVVNGFDLLVVHGAVSVCTATSDDRIIFECDPLPPLPLKQLYYVRLMENLLTGADRIVIRNRSDKGSSRFEIHGWQKVSMPVASAAMEAHLAAGVAVSAAMGFRGLRPLPGISGARHPAPINEIHGLARALGSALDRRFPDINYLRAARFIRDDLSNRFPGVALPHCASVRSQRRCG